MDFSLFENNPLLKEMAPEKLQFLMNFANTKKPASMQEMMPFLLSFANTAKSNNIQFSNSETELLINLLKQNLSPQEAAKADKIIQLMNSRNQKKS